MAGPRLETTANASTVSDDLDAPLIEKREKVEYWQEAIREQQLKFEQYHNIVNAIERDTFNLDRLASSSREREMQVLWANFEVLKAAIYANAPIPAVAARHKERKNPAVVHAVEILERSLSSVIDMEGMHDILLTIRDDLLISSRGVPWVMYKAGDEDNPPRVWVEDVEREDFLHSGGRSWRKVWWVARRMWINRDDAEMWFAEYSGDLWKELDFGRREEVDGIEEGDELAQVWVIWDKAEGVVGYLSMELHDWLLVETPPFKVSGFFPCPKPCYGTTERKSLLPIPHFVYIKDQLEEVNELTARISALSEGLKVKGFYNAGVEEIADAIERILEDDDNRQVLVPVKATSISGQSLANQIVWLPVDMVAKVIASLIELRKQLIADIYEITGLSDIMRGATDPRETRGAQELKAQFGSVRVKDMQEQVVRMIRDCVSIMGEIIAELFPIEHILEIAQYTKLRSRQEIINEAQALMAQAQQAASDPQTMAKLQDPQQAQQVKAQAQQAMARIEQLRKEVSIEDVDALLKNERLRPFVIDIETDSTIRPDEDRIKQRTNEFTQVLSVALGQLSQMVAAMPESARLAGELLKFQLRPYRAGRDVEVAIDEMIDTVINKPPQEDPRVKAEQAKIKAQQEIEMAKVNAQGEIEKLRNEGKKEVESLKANADSQLKQLDLNNRAEIERTREMAGVEKARMDHAHAMEQLRIKAEELELKRQELELKREAEANRKAEAARNHDLTKHKIDTDALAMRGDDDADE